MDEKIKIIKDIEKYIAFWFVTQEAITDYKAEVEEEIKERKRAYATALYNAGYRKIPENAVVLTREELEERDCKNHHEGHKTGVAGMQEQVESLNTLYNGALTDYENSLKNLRNICKETAEKFAEMLKDEYLPIISAYFTDDEKEEEQELNYRLCQLTDEICKEIMEEKKDGNDGRNV